MAKIVVAKEHKTLGRQLEWPPDPPDVGFVVLFETLGEGQRAVLTLIVEPYSGSHTTFSDRCFWPRSTPKKEAYGYKASLQNQGNREAGGKMTSGVGASLTHELT